jgi:UDP-N-acetylmuramoylalanine--D-glutamate ligase
VSKLSLDWHELRRKPVAILGAGVSGRGVEKLLHSLDWEYATFDQQSRAFGWTEAKACSVAVVSPGFAPDHSWIEIAKKAGMTVLGEADFASAFWPGKIVAVTGTNGKTTLVRFLAKLFNETNRSAVATGNIGYSFSDLVAERRDSSVTAMLELSSFQTENLRLLQPDAVIWTNVAEDHLDRHSDMPSYIRAKSHLVDRLESGPFLAGSERKSCSRPGICRFAGNKR